MKLGPCGQMVLPFLLVHLHSVSGRGISENRRVGNGRQGEGREKRKLPGPNQPSFMRKRQEIEETG